MTCSSSGPAWAYDGGQAFNLGGRSVFWGGFIPRMSWWELESWPNAVSWDVENFAYQRAEDLMYWPPPPGRRGARGRHATARPARSRRLSVFPTSPAANPSLTLAALALRLADPLEAKL